MSNQNENSISRNFALNLAKELKAVNKEIIQEITKNNDLINQLIRIYELDEEEVSDGEFTNTFSKSPNIAYGHSYHDFDEDGCEEHYCCDCIHTDKEQDEQPCVTCSNIANSDNCYFEHKHDPRPIKSYDECYNPISHIYLECHSSNDCNHSISTCKYCKYHETPENQVPCIGCNCVNKQSVTCFHVDNEN